jgi:hypothetical protein
MTKKFEVILKSTKEADYVRLISGMRFLAKTNPKKYKLKYDKDGDLTLFEYWGYDLWMPRVWARHEYKTVQAT